MPVKMASNGDQSFIGINNPVDIVNGKIGTRWVRGYCQKVGHRDGQFLRIATRHQAFWKSGQNFNLKLRALGRVTPFEAIRKGYQKNPEIFNINPNHTYIVGLTG